MRVMQGRSWSTCGEDAVREASATWSHDPEIVFAFASTAQRPADVARALAARFPDVPLVGCSTAGERATDGHSNGSLVLTGLADSGIEWAIEAIEDLEGFDAERATGLVERLFEELDAPRDHRFRPQDFLCLLVIDGLSHREEVVTDRLACALDGVRLAGGSAADDMRYEATWVFSEGRALTGAAIVTLARRPEHIAIDIVKHQNFTTNSRSLVITRADSDARRVYEIDGYPALEAYAAALGLWPGEVDETVTFMHPLALRCDGQIWVRSIQTIHDDGSISFSCSVEEGMVLDLGGHVDMCDALRSDLVPGAADFMLEFNCILRAREATARRLNEEIAAIARDSSTASTGFDTYGEQLDGLHINQTLVAVCFRDRREGG